MNYYEVVVQLKLEQEDSKGGLKIKTINEQYLVDAMSVTEAEARIVKKFSDSKLEFQVVAVKNSKIIEVVNS